MMSIEQILQEELVLVDTCLAPKRERNYLSRIFNISKVSESEIEHALEDEDYREELFTNPNVMTIPEVLEEREKYLRMINAFMSRKIKEGKNNSDRNKVHKRNSLDKDRLLLKNLYDAVARVNELIKRGILEFDTQDYSRLCYRVATRVYEMGIKTLSKEEPFIGTDEKLLASAYYSALTSDIDPCLLTCDHHISRTHRAMSLLKEPGISKIVSRTKVYILRNNKFLPVYTEEEANHFDYPAKAN